MKKIFLIIIIILLLAGAAFVVFKYLNKADEPIIDVQPKEDITIESFDKFFNDQDKDGIKDEEEEKLGTSLYEFDTDKDGLSDKSEIEKWGTDPTVEDTDGDGFGDAIEVINGYNPLGEGKI